jgi:hypothetical protein
MRKPDYTPTASVFFSSPMATLDTHEFGASNKKRRRVMRCLASFVLALVALFPLDTFAQAPDAQRTPKTKLESFEAQEGFVIVQGFSRIAELHGTFGGTVTVSAMEFTNATTGRRESGITIDVKEAGRLERSSRSFIDYDEIAALLKGIDYIGKVDRSVTRLENFQADYRTKGDLRVSTFNTGAGVIMFAVSSGRIGALSVHLKFADLAIFRNYLSSAKDRLDTAKQ